MFLQDLPPGLPPGRKGHQFEIKFKDNVSLVYKPLYKMIPLGLEEAKKQIQSRCVLTESSCQNSVPFHSICHLESGRRNTTMV